MTAPAPAEPAPRDLRGASAQERDALLRTLYETVGPRILGLGHRYFGGRRDLAEELVAETFARVITGIDRFAGRSAYSTWIFRIAMNVAAQWIRDETRDRSGAADAEPQARGRPSDRADAAERRRLVDEALRALPPEHRMVLALVVVDGLTSRASRNSSVSPRAPCGRATRVRASPWRASSSAAGWSTRISAERSQEPALWRAGRDSRHRAAPAAPVTCPHAQAQ